MSERQDAKKQNLVHYFTGKKCRWGHISQRFTSTGQCVTCMENLGKQHRSENTEISLRHYHKHKGELNYWASRKAHSAKQSARRRNVPFDLTKEYILSLIPQNRLCPVFHTVMIFGSSDRHAPDNASLDRLLPKLGYVRGNVSIISMRANRLKYDAVNAHELRAVADYMDTVQAVVAALRNK